MSALEVTPFHGIALYKSTFTYLLANMVDNMKGIPSQYDK